jgi:hypothetical protein
MTGFEDLEMTGLDAAVSEQPVEGLGVRRALSDRHWR